MSNRTAVLIPHYQHAPGILARTLRSVFAQVNAPPLRLIIVDDGSPVSAEEEMASLDPGCRTRVTVIHRANGGTSRARNTGLEAIPQQTDYVALLDGDDIWREDHLSHALEAMEMGFDFFFSDHRRQGYARTWFHEADFRPERHTLLKSESELHAFDGSFFDTILRKSPVGTSTVVMRQATLGALRFDNDVGTYDDLLFWLKVAQRTDRIAFSARELVTLGEGINQSIVPDWRSNKSLRYGLSEASYFGKLQNTLQLSPAQQDLVERALRKAQNSLARTLLAMLAAGRPVELRILARMIRNHPAVLAAIPPVVIDGIRHKTRKCVNAGHSADA